MYKNNSVTAPQWASTDGGVQQMFDAIMEHLDNWFHSRPVKLKQVQTKNFFLL